MYNKFPYFRDIDICTQETITLVTGNVLKYFQYSMRETYPLLDIDTLALQKIQAYKKREEERKLASFEVIDTSPLSSDSLNEIEDTSAKTPSHPDYLDIDFE